MKKGTEDTCDKETVPIWTQQREESLVGVRGVTGDALLQCMEGRGASLLFSPLSNF